MNYRNSSSLVSGRTEYGGPGNTVLRAGGRRTAECRPYRRGTVDSRVPSLRACHSERSEESVPRLYGSRTAERECRDGGRLGAVPTGGGRRTAKLRHYRRNGSLPRAARWPGVRLPYELRAELLPKTDELSVILCIS